MEHQVGIGYGIHTSMRQKTIDVSAQFLTHFERMNQLVHQLLLVITQVVRVLSVDGRQVGVE